jgi:hypothetical protein
MLTHGIAETEGGGVAKTPMRASTRPPKQWRRIAKESNPEDPRIGHPRVWLMGDAVHAMQPHRYVSNRSRAYRRFGFTDMNSAMGGNQALRDCAEVLSYMIKLNTSFQTNGSVSDNEIQSLVQSYEDEMIERAFEWVEKSGGSVIPVSIGPNSPTE